MCVRVCVMGLLSRVERVTRLQGGLADIANGARQDGKGFSRRAEKSRNERCL